MRRKTFAFPVSTIVGSSIRNIRAIKKGHHVEPKYRFKFWISVVIAAIFEIFNLIERIFWQKKINKFRPEEPHVFIIGFWRSGTTLLHNLLCQDPKAAYTTTFQTVFPNLILTQSWWLKRIINFFIPANRPYDNVCMDVDFPQEEDFGLMSIQPSSIYKFFLYPDEFDKIVDSDLHTGNLSKKLVDQWKKAYREMIAKAVFNTGGSRYIGKNPCHLTRINLLREMYPDAKFIFIHRHPYQVIGSLYRFILSIFPGTKLQDVPDNFSVENVARLYQKVMNSYFEDSLNIPSDQFISISMEDFMNDINGNMNHIYRKFNLGDYSKVEPLVEKFLKKYPRQSHNAYPPEAETIEIVEKYASEVIEKLGYRQNASAV